MSPQPSPVRSFPLEDLGETGSLIFGEASPSPLTIPNALIAEIWGQVNEGVRILPRGGAEVGGLLVGPKSRKSGVVVDKIIPLSIEYKHGPSFRMSASDLAKIAVPVESVQVDPSKAVVGFYRSQTRGDDTLRSSDREIFDAIEQVHTSFDADFLCCFVLSAVSKSEMSACVSMRNGEDWHETRFTLGSNPFSVVQAASSVARPGNLPAQVQVDHPLEARLVQAVPQTVPQLPAEYGPSAPEPEPNAAGRPLKLLFATAGLLALAGAVGGYRWIVKNRAEPATSSRAQISASPTRMGFSANREGPVWKLSWDRGAMDVIKPSGAILVIEDGNSEQVLNLTPADLSSGTIFYTPQAGDLVFKLQLDRGDATPIEEHIRVLEGPRSVQKSAERGPQAVPNNTPVQTTAAQTAAVQTKASARGSTLPAELPRVTGSGSGREAPVTPILSASSRTNARPAETPATPAIIRDTPPGLAETPPPPAIAFAIPVAPRIAPPVDRELPSPRAPSLQPAPNPGGAADPKNTPAPEAVVPSAPSAAAAKPPNTAPPATLPSAAVAPPLSQNYVGPKPVQQVRPQPSANMNASGVQVQIHVEIDARGKVTKATPTGSTAANPALLFVTVRAARSWQFEPAKTDGRPVPSEMDLVFRF